MKIKCPQCIFENLEGSEFCQECGHSLKKSSSKKTEISASKPLHKEIEEISDVIFKPKKKRHRVVNLIVTLIFIGIVGFGLLLLLFPEEEPYSDGNNGTTEQENTTDFPIHRLNIVDYDMKWEGDELYFIGTLKNLHNQPVRDVNVRIDFYWDKELKQKFDTRTVSIIGAEADGAFSFQIPVYVYPQGDFWWKIRTESASY